MKKIEKIDDNNELSILNAKGYLPLNNNINQKNLNHYPILDLSNHLLKLANQIFNEVSKLIGPDTKTDILFNKICVILLIDGSCYINPKKKVFNFHILCSFAIVLHLLEIPYGISVVADGRYKIILKQFEDPHSFEIFEKVYECLMIRRFRDNLANSQKFAKETYMFSKEYKSIKEGEKPNFYDEHPKKIIITITDGLDEELKLTSQWNKTIFNDPDISFGFIFYKPDLDNIKDKEKIEKLWNNFINETKKASSRVIVNIIDKEMKNYSKLAEFLRDLIGNKFKNLDLNNSVDYEPSFLEEEIILNSIETLNNISFKERGNKIKDNQIYIRNYPLKYLSDGIIKNDNMSFDKNKLGQICQGKVNKFIEKRFRELIENFIIKQSDIDKMSLEKIFKKNKASQKVLSTSGSEIDIVSLIISILNKEPRPKIFWEETGEMKRQYSVSIIIDNSISCFGDISRAHSFQVIRELLSPLLYIEISKLDIILTTDKSPTILCSDVDSQKCLRKESPIWIGLFKFLQTPFYGSSLSSALNFVYNINKERNEYTKILFVLTDGLSEKNEQIYISKQIHYCNQLDMNIIGIGIGPYPIGIENIFEKIIYTIDPSNLLLGLSGFFEQIHTNTSEKMIGFEYQAKMSEFQEIIKKLSKNKDFYFNNLIKELKKIEVNYTTFEFFNKPVPLENHFKSLNEAINPVENENTLMLKENYLKNKKILIVMLWSYDLNPSKENEKVKPENLFRSGKINTYLKNKKDGKNTICVESAVDIFGLEIYVVLDYENAIKELTRKNENNNCDYNIVWVMCGPQKAIIPNPKSDPNLIGEFMKVINIFWSNGGSIVFFADGDPLFYQVNLFLENAEFPVDDEEEEDEVKEDGEKDSYEHNDDYERNNNNSNLNDKKSEYDYDNESKEKSSENFLNLINFISKKDTINENNKFSTKEEKNKRKYNEEEEDYEEEENKNKINIINDFEEEDEKEENKNKINIIDEKIKFENNIESEEEEIKEKEEKRDKVYKEKNEEENEDSEEKKEENEEENEEEKEEEEIEEEEIEDKEDKEEEEEKEEKEEEKEVREEEDEEREFLKSKKIRAHFSIGGSHKGGKTLLRDVSGLLNENKLFNASNNVITHLKRPNIGTNLLKIYEGVTISYAIENNEGVLDIFNMFGLSRNRAMDRYRHLLRNENPIYPFVPFAKDSEGGISILIYYGRQNYGDIVIDCGFTKCFLEMEEEGTFRYIRNLVSLISRCDVLMNEGENPQTWKPDAIDYKLDLTKNYFWNNYQRKIYIIDVDSEVNDNDKTYMYDRIKEELYSKYNNIIYFVNTQNGKETIDLEDIKKIKLKPNSNNQNNLKQVAYDIIEECNHKFENNYYIDIFCDGIASANENKVMDYILSCKSIPIDKRSFLFLPELNRNITPDFISNTLNNLKNIKTYEDLIQNYKNIRNSLLFSFFEYSIQISSYNIKNEIERIENEINEEIENDEEKLKLFKEKMEILEFYSNVEVENLGINAAAYV